MTIGDQARSVIWTCEIVFRSMNPLRLAVQRAALADLGLHIMRFNMNALRVVLAAAVLGVVAGGAQAAVMASGPVWDTCQAHVTCYLFNSGTATVNVTGREMYVERGTTEPLVEDTCGALAPGATCYIEADVTRDASHACKFTVSNAAPLRGAIEVRDIGVNVMNSQEIR